MDPCSTTSRRQPGDDVDDHGRAVLLVIAHPDDEAMFFAPAVAHFNNAHGGGSGGGGVAVLCLSNGDADGLGAVREKELLASCAALGVLARGVTVLNRSDLRDGMRTEWPLGSVAAAVEAEVRRRRPRAVATFDAYGVSGHGNHRAVHAGVRMLLEQRGRALGIESAWQLVSLSALRKFSGPLERYTAKWLAPRGALVLANGRLAAALAAMRAHRSQWVWYRKLFVRLSAYAYVNTLAPLPLG